MFLASYVYVCLFFQPAALYVFAMLYFGVTHYVLYLQSRLLSFCCLGSWCSMFLISALQHSLFFLFRALCFLGYCVSYFSLALHYLQHHRLYSNFPTRHYLELFCHSLPLYPTAAHSQTACCTPYFCRIILALASAVSYSISAIFSSLFCLSISLFAMFHTLCTLPHYTAQHHILF